MCKKIIIPSWRCEFTLLKNIDASSKIVSLREKFRRSKFGICPARSSLGWGRPQPLKVRYSEEILALYSNYFLFQLFIHYVLVQWCFHSLFLYRPLAQDLPISLDEYPDSHFHILPRNPVCACVQIGGWMRGRKERIIRNLVFLQSNLWEKLYPEG